MATFQSKVNAAYSTLEAAQKEFWGRLALGCSFGKDSMVVLHMALRLMPRIDVFTALSDTEFGETYTFMDKIVRQWDLSFSRSFFKQTGGLVECCGPPKVEATKIALIPYEAWISGIRRSEGVTRACAQTVERDLGVVKINPLLDFTEQDVWRYTAIHGIPVHPMYTRGYRSLGCRKCSIPELDEGEPERAGRWAGTSKQGGECGIHNEPLR